MTQGKRVEIQTLHTGNSISLKKLDISSTTSIRLFPSILTQTLTIVYGKIKISNLENFSTGGMISQFFVQSKMEKLLDRCTSKKKKKKKNSSNYSIEKKGQNQNWKITNRCEIKSGNGLEFPEILTRRNANFWKKEIKYWIFLWNFISLSFKFTLVGVKIVKNSRSFSDSIP